MIFDWIEAKNTGITLVTASIFAEEPSEKKQIIG
jgi:hypothetical protein